MGIAQTKHGSKLNMEATGDAHIPYTSHVDPYTLKTRDGKLCQVIKLEGVAHQTSDTDQLNLWKNKRNFLWRSIASNNVSVWTHIIRYKKSDYPAGKYKDSFAGQLNEKYKASIEKNSMYVNDIYITVITNVKQSQATKFFDLFKNLTALPDNDAIRKEQRVEINNLSEITGKVMETLSQYTPRLLSAYYRTLDGKKVINVKNPQEEIERPTLVKLTSETEKKQRKAGLLNAFSEPLEFLAYLVNGYWRNIPMGYKDVANTILNSKIQFEKEYFTLEGNGKKQFGATVSVKEYTSETAPGMFDALLTLPVEFVLTQSMTFIGKAAASTLLSTHQARLKSSGDLAESQIDDIYEAQDQLISNEFVMGEHHMSLTVMGRSYKQVVNDITRCESPLSDIGVITARENLGLEPCFWAQLPANNSYIARLAPITSKNFASFASLHNFPIGKLVGNYWGDAVALFKTISGTPYYFNFHYPKDLGNTTVIGPSGAGKTVLMLFLAALLEKHDVKQIFFDKDRGAEIFIRAQGGVYSSIEAGQPTGFNPLQLPDTPSNRKFLRDWLAKLLEDNNNPLTSSDYAEINMAVNGNFKLPASERRLRNIEPFFQTGEKNGIKKRLQNWLSGHERGWVFDNPTDKLTIDSRLLGFDVTDFLDDPILRTPILMYLFHRIDVLIDGSRLALWMDEGWKLLDDEYFGNTFKNKLKVIRKQNGFTVFGTQEPADVLTSAVGKTIMSQSPTQIFLPNPKADHNDYVKGFKLSNREFEIIKELDLESRCFLIKQGQKSVVAQLDLAGMDDEISVLSGTTSNVELLTGIRKEVGDNPKDWLPVFQSRRAK